MADILKWEFPTEQFNVIVSIVIVHHLPLLLLLPNLKAALKPGGQLLILDLVKYENILNRLSDFIAVPLSWIFKRSGTEQL
ncbi:hypothetical protein [Nostoc sp. LEGE 12447]|uniref:hypothetical protein n=1 Tax=Nostoc sp. LEGE 12447 TaxID=1828640 RepID=UPI002AD3B341|nr:hypothetical protein [Nostoc sp. LEGE 12447]